MLHRATDFKALVCLCLCPGGGGVIGNDVAIQAKSVATMQSQSKSNGRRQQRRKEYYKQPESELAALVIWFLDSGCMSGEDCCHTESISVI